MGKKDSGPWEPQGLSGATCWPPGYNVTDLEIEAEEHWWRNTISEASSRAQNSSMEQGKTLCSPSPPLRPPITCNAPHIVLEACRIGPTDADDGLMARRQKRNSRRSKDGQGKGGNVKTQGQGPWTLDLEAQLAYSHPLLSSPCLVLLSLSCLSPSLSLSLSLLFCVRVSLYV